MVAPTKEQQQRKHREDIRRVEESLLKEDVHKLHDDLWDKVCLTGSETLHYAQYTIHYTHYTLHYAQYTIHITHYTILYYTISYAMVATMIEAIQADPDQVRG